MAKDVLGILGDYEPKGKTIKGVGKFILWGIDDPFHITTVSGALIYGVGKIIESRSPYGIRRAKMDLAEIKRQMRELILDISSLRV